MRTFVQKPKAAQQTTSGKPAMPVRAHSEPHHEVNSILYLQRTIGNQAVQRLLQRNAEERNTILTGTASPHPGHDLARIPVSLPNADALQTKLAINAAGDEYEQEADRVAEQVMRMSGPPAQRHAPQEEKEIHVQAKEGNNWPPKAVPMAENPIQAPHGDGQPLPEVTRAFFQSRFGRDFSHVRVHTDASAADAAQALNALAYTSGHHIVFGVGQYAPLTNVGKRLLAHELGHVVQQGNSPATSPVQRQLSAPPTKLVTSEVEEISFPEADEATLDSRIKSRQAQDALGGKGKYIGTVTYKNLPAVAKTATAAKETNLERRAVKHALLETIITNINEKGGIENRVRVPLDDSPVASEYAMVVMRFDKQRNIEVEYAGKDVQEKGAVAEPSSILSRLKDEYGVEFVTDSITVKMPGAKAVSTFTGKSWSANDAVLLKDALLLVGSKEKGILKGCKIRRLDAEMANTAAGFYSTADNSINLANAALPFDKAIWFGEGGKFYTRGVHTVLHEIGHALHYSKIPAGGKKASKIMMDLFEKAVLDESKKRTKKASAAGFPPPGIIVPTDYSAKSWNEFFADTYSIYITNPSFLNTAEFKYLYDFFKQQFP